METPDATTTPTGEPVMTLDREAFLNLHETGGWANFLAILGFIMIGFLVLLGFFVGAVLSTLPMGESGLPFPTSVFTAFYFLIAVIYFFPVYYLYKFAVGVRQGIPARNSQQVGAALRNLKSHYKFVGIMTITMFILYIVGILLFMALGAGKMMGDSVNA